MSKRSLVNLIIFATSPVVRTNVGSFHSNYHRLRMICKAHSFARHENKSCHTWARAPNLIRQKLCTPQLGSPNGRNLLRSSFEEPILKFGTTSSFSGVDKSISAPLTKRQAQDLILRLTGEERSALLCALQEFQSESLKAEYEGQLAGQRWRSKFGRPSKVPHLGDVDPTGSYCPVPEDWLRIKAAERVVPPSTRELVQVGIHNALPFVGFGFLDNFCMILAGDYIELTLGTMMVISTMAAAALGNTISDILGIGSAWYVERMAAKVGVRPPELTPIQLEMGVSRWAANLGRVIGVTLGCLLGMIPLIFLNTKDEGKNPEVAPT